MPNALKKRVRSPWVPVILFSLLAGGLAARQSVPLGLGISPDTTAYIEMARDIRQHGVFAFGHATGVVYPLGYPAVLAAVGWLFGLDPLAAAVPLHIVLTSLTVFVFLLDARRLSGVSPWLSGLLATFSLVLFRTAAMALAETLFIFLVVITLYGVKSWERSMWRPVGLGLVSGAACLVKYVGVALAPVVVLVVLATGSAVPRRRIRAAATYLGVFGSVVGGYALRNLSLAESVWAHRPRSRTPLHEIFGQLRGTITSWFIPEVPKSEWLYLALGLVLVVLLWRARHRIRAGLRDHTWWLAPYPLFVVVYVAMMIYLSARYAFDGIGDRLLAPVYPGLAMSILFLVAPHGGRRGRSIDGTAVARWFVVLILLAQPFRLVLKDTHRRGKLGGGGYNDPAWRESPLLRECLPQFESDSEVIFSNCPGVLYTLAGVRSQAVPAWRYYNSDDETGLRVGDLPALYPDLDGALLVIFDVMLARRPYLFTPDDLAEVYGVDPVASCSDGTIYRLSIRADDRAEPEAGHR